MCRNLGIRQRCEKGPSPQTMVAPLLQAMLSVEGALPYMLVLVQVAASAERQCNTATQAESCWHCLYAVR